MAIMLANPKATHTSNGTPPKLQVKCSPIEREAFIHLSFLMEKVVVTWARPLMLNLNRIKLKAMTRGSDSAFPALTSL